MKKAHLLMFLSHCVSIILLLINAQALESAHGTCGSEIMWSLDSNGTLTIDGKGVMYDFDPVYPTPWSDFSDQIHQVEIQEGVTSIGVIAFNSCVNLSSLSIPVGFQSISYGAFEGCRHLTSVSIPKSMERIEERAFAMCDSLSDIYYEGNQEDWTSIQIATHNDAFLQATVHYQTYEKCSPAKTPQLSDLAFSFRNNVVDFGYSESYSIPLERYQLIYGNTPLAEQLCASDIGFKGNSYGMAVVAALFYQNDNNISASLFNSSAIHPAQLSLSDRYPEWNLSLSEFIEAIEVSRKSAAVSKACKENANQLSALFFAEETFQYTGQYPPVICMVGSEGTYELLGYRTENISDTEIRLYVYDSAFPDNSNCFIVLNKDMNGEYTGWHYAPTDQLNWGSSLGQSITYIPYSVFSSVWEMRGESPNEMLLLTLSETKAEVYSIENSLVTSFEDAFLLTNPSNKDDSIYPVVLRNKSDNPSIWLPVNNVYTLKLESIAEKHCQIRACNVQNGISISTSATALMLSVEDITASAYIQIAQPEQEYSIRVVSNLSKDSSIVELHGVTKKETAFSLSQQANMLILSGIDESEQLYINGIERPVENYYAEPLDSNAANFAFDDVSQSSYFYSAVYWAVSHGITNGTTKTTFSPYTTCTKQNIITFLWRAFQCPESNMSNPFTDVSADSYYAKAAIWAYENGLETGSTFEGMHPCTRATAVMYLWMLSGSPMVEDTTVFTDIPNNADYLQAISWAISKGITKGTTNTTFSPDRICTRGQIVTFLYRYFTDY